MRAPLSHVVNPAVALLLAGLATSTVAAEAPSVKTAQTVEKQAASKLQAPVEIPVQQQVARPTAAPETQSVHIQVGRSIVLNTQAKLRRLVVSNPNVLDTVTVSAIQVVVTAKAPGSSSLVLWDESSNARILDVYADVDVSGLREGIRSAFPTEPVQIEAEQGRVLATGTVTSKAIADDVLKMASVYSKDVVNSLTVTPPHQKQVMLKVRFAEVDRSRLEEFGINILSTGAANTIGTVSTQQFGTQSAGSSSSSSGSTLPGKTTITTSDLLNIFVFRPDLNLGATVRDLQQNNVLQILAEPNLLARSGVPAKFLAGGEFPYPVVQSGNNVGAVTIEFRQYGVKLEFTGNIEGNKVRLKVAPEVSALDYTNTVTVSGFVMPAISTRRAETEIELRDGQSFGIAGLLDNRTTAMLSKVPGIGDIPILGMLFRSKSVKRSNTELLVLVTPTIVDPASEQVSAPQLPAEAMHKLDVKSFDEKLETKFYQTK
ncbi:MAG: type II and III secretion system protein [Acidobacteria bacterium]|nr:MAG: type II and III secretion system protein [Acidobacteriota bacterium]